MNNIFKIGEAVRLAIQTHEVDQKQKRKGKDIPYITHPVIVGLILANAGASEDVVIAGILHDTIEDSIPEKKVTRETLASQFGEEVAALVESVSESDKSLPWEERKKEALEHIKTFSKGSLLVKSADIIQNVSELRDDYAKEGEKVFARFNAPKEKIIGNYLGTIAAVIQAWEENPLAGELEYLAWRLPFDGGLQYGSASHSNIIKYADFDEDMILECSLCRWKGSPRTGGDRLFFKSLFDVRCPICNHIILIVDQPAEKE